MFRWRMCTNRVCVGDESQKDNEASAAAKVRDYSASLARSLAAKVRDSVARSFRKSSIHSGSIFAYHDFDWPEIEELEEIEKHVLDGGNMTMEKMDCEDKDCRKMEDKGISYTLFKEIEAEGELKSILARPYWPGKSATVARRCRQINHSLQMKQAEWVWMIKISTLADKISSAEKKLNDLKQISADKVISKEQKVKLLEEKSLNDFGVDRLGYEFLDLDVTYSNIESSGDVEAVEAFIAGLSAKLESHVERLKEEKKEYKEKLFSILEKQFRKGFCLKGQNREGFSPGPVGDLPIHDCYLLDLTDIGLEVIEKYFHEPDTLSLPYTNDLSPWRVGTKDRESLEWEDGLYSGETVLHIAIVKEKVEVAEKLLSKGIALSSRAKGVFFQPKWVRPRVGSLSVWQRFKAWVGGMDLTDDKFAALKEYLNPDSVRCGKNMRMILGRAARKRRPTRVLLRC
jgi:hypothetical protein